MPLRVFRPRTVSPPLPTPPLSSPLQSSPVASTKPCGGVLCFSIYTKADQLSTRSAAVYGKCKYDEYKRGTSASVEVVKRRLKLVELQCFLQGLEGYDNGDIFIVYELWTV